MLGPVPRGTEYEKRISCSHFVNVELNLFEQGQSRPNGTAVGASKMR